MSDGRPISLIVRPQFSNVYLRCSRPLLSLPRRPINSSLEKKRTTPRLFLSLSIKSSAFLVWMFRLSYKSMFPINDTVRHSDHVIFKFVRIACSNMLLPAFKIYFKSIQRNQSEATRYCGFAFYWLLIANTVMRYAANTLHGTVFLCYINTNLLSCINICIKKIIQLHFSYKVTRKMWLDNFLYAYVYAASLYKYTLGAILHNLHSRINICIKKIIQSYFTFVFVAEMWLDNFLYSYGYATMQVCVEWPLEGTF